MNFFFFLITIILICFFFSGYLFNPMKQLKRFSLFFFLLSIFSLFVYFTKGKLSIFNYDRILKEDLLTSETVDPKKLIIFLERNLDYNSDKLDDFLILARSYVFNGYIQKANSLYLKCLEIFPNNEELMLEVAIFKRQNNEDKFAISLFERVYELNPQNINNISNYLESILQIEGKSAVIEKIKQFEKDGHLEKKFINKVLEELKKN